MFIGNTYGCGALSFGSLPGYSSVTRMSVLNCDFSNTGGIIFAACNPNANMLIKNCIFDWNPLPAAVSCTGPVTWTAGTIPHLRITDSKFEGCWQILGPNVSALVDSVWADGMPNAANPNTASF